MTRSIEEIEKEIRETIAEHDDLVECAGLYRTEKGYWEWKNPLLIRRINECKDHLHNLKLELNRAKQRQWGHSK